MKIQSRWLTQAISSFLVWFLRGLYRTCRIQAVEYVPGTTPYEGPNASNPERFLYCIWHDILLMAIFSGKPCHMAGLVSRHQDGTYLAETMRKVGIEPIRGSSKRGGPQALKQCLNAAKEYHVSITPDGPRGPRHEMKEGIIFMASQTGRRIVPVSASCKRFWRIQGNWTDMLVPKPFTKILILTGEPLFVPPNLNREEIQHYLKIMEQRMIDLTHLAESASHDSQFTFPTSSACPTEPQQSSGPSHLKIKAA